MKIKIFISIFSFVVFFIFITNSNSETVFSNYGPNFSHSSTTGWGVTNGLYGSPEGGRGIGMKFTVNSNNYRVDSYLFTASLAVGENYFRIQLVNDESNSPGSKVLEEIGCFNCLQSLTWQHHEPFKINSFKNPILRANHSYWFILSAYESGTDILWYGNVIGQTGSRASWYHDRWNIVNDIAPSVFQIYGIPENKPKSMPWLPLLLLDD
jgi:hypothetical protein